MTFLHFRYRNRLGLLASSLLDPGESAESPRVRRAAGPGLAVAYHAFLEQVDARLDSMPRAIRVLRCSLSSCKRAP